MVRLRRAQPALGLKKGDMGAIVHVYQGGAAYEIEFAASGLIPVLATLEPGDIVQPWRSGGRDWPSERQTSPLARRG